MNRRYHGFTLIEVLLALAVISIALTALLKATIQNTAFTNRIKDKSIGHWVAMQGVASIQLKLVTLVPGQETTHTTEMAGRTWSWRASATPTALTHMQQIRIKVSTERAGPFSDPLIAYWYVP